MSSRPITQMINDVCETNSIHNSFKIGNICLRKYQRGNQRS